MDLLKEKFQAQALLFKNKLKDLLAQHAETVIDQVTLDQAIGGMRGIKSMFWVTSDLDANEGITFRGYSIPQLKEKLVKAPGDTEPLPEALFWLMLTDSFPSEEEAKWLSAELQRRGEVPAHVWATLEALPLDCHPMTQFCIAITAMQTGSEFSRRYEEGMHKSLYWEATYEDTLNLLAKLPRVAAYIYRRTFKEGVHIAADESLDWGANFAHMLGYDQPDFQSLMRLYLTIHADHEGGNASAHATHLVGSTLSDAYLSLTAGMTALAGPLHGLANQEVIRWILDMLEEIGTQNPSEEQIADYVRKTLSEGKVVPGYGHAVLRMPDPRFIAQMKFAEAHLPDSEIVQVVWRVYHVVPPILESLGKVKNPWPNVDAHSGALLIHYGMTEFDFYTVLFGVSRAMGVLAQLCWSRALGLPLERPKSITLEWISQKLNQPAVV